ncbi:MAG TPA: hypothetical protein VEO01_26405 [Pseudonocardiaceae bacterium]|nr:hypothetical protein [Pseudonocardiaceae bacterium]
MGYDVGQKVNLSTVVKDTNGAPIDATMDLAVNAPDGTVTHPTPINHPSTGNYNADYVPVLGGGIYWYVWTASGAAVAVDQGQIWVRDLGPRIVSLADVKRHLNRDLTDTSDDEELKDFIDMITVPVENICGAVLPRTVIEYHDGEGGDRTQLALRQKNVLSITSVVESWYGTNYTLTQESDLGVGSPAGYAYTYDADTCLLTRRSGWMTWNWAPGQRNIKITYRVGMSPITQNVRTGSLELVAHIWRSSQLASGTQRATNPQDLVGLAYAVPNRVREILLGSGRGPLVY